MKGIKSIALVAMGSAITLAYLKYKDPVMDTLENAFNKTKKDATKMLDDMM